LVRRSFNAGNDYVGQPLIERSVVPEIVFGTADARMAGLYWPASAAIPPHVGASIVSRRPAAAHFVQAPAFARSLVVPGFDKLACIEKGAAVALVVHALPVEHFRTALPVEFGNRAECEQ